MVGPVQSSGGALRFNPLHPSFRLDPYDIYTRLRTEAPHYRTLGTLVLTRYKSVNEALCNRDLSTEAIPQALFALAKKWNLVVPERFARFLKATLLFAAEEKHRALQLLLTRAIAPAMIKNLRPQILNRVAERLETVAPLETFDLINDIAAPLWGNVVADWVGLSERDREGLAENALAARGLLDPSALRPETLLEVFHGIEALYVKILHAYRNPCAPDALLSRLRDIRRGEARLDEEQIVFSCIEFVLGGSETTQALIGNLINALLVHPQQLEMVRRDRSLMSAAVEETIRFETPVPMTRRVALRDTVVDGEVVRKGESILLCLAAANRDPTEFEAPDGYDIRRKGRHLAFGYGFHACVGAALARLQAEVVLEQLLERFSNIELVELVPAWQQKTLMLRSRERLLLRGMA